MRSVLWLCPAVLVLSHCGPVPCEQAPGNGCNTLRNSSAEVIEATAVGALPSAAGGAVADGTYHCSDYRWFTDKPEKYRRLTLEVTGTKFEFVDQQNAGADTAITSTATFGASAGITIEVSCPRVATLEFDQYSVAGNQLLLISNVDRKVVTFTRQ
jgi:hypothetical protein